MLSTPREIVPTTATPHEPRSVDFGIVIGVDHYPRFRPLRGAIEDASRFYTWLRDDDGGGIAKDNVSLVLSKASPASPLQDDIDEHLAAIIEAARSIGGGRRLYFHFSGHGAGSINESKEDVALLLAKWSRTFYRLALSIEAYRGALNGAGLFEELVISLDCCRTSADGAIGVAPSFALPPHTPDLETRCFIAYATQRGRPAFEVSSDNLWQGVFTRCLLGVLQRSPHGITAARLKSDLEYAVKENGQRAHVINGLRDGSMFGHRGVLPRVVVMFDKAVGSVRLRNGARQVIAEYPVCPGPWELSLEAGLYQLEDDTRQTIRFDLGGEAVSHVWF